MMKQLLHICTARAFTSKQKIKYSPTFFLFVPDCVTLFLITPVVFMQSFRSSRSGTQFVAKHVGCFSSLQWGQGTDVGAQVVRRPLQKRHRECGDG